MYNAYSPMRLASRYWWLMLIWGILVALFGLCALFWPHLTLLTLIFLFGAFALVNGILGIATAIQQRHEFPYWWAALGAGVVSLLIGLAVMFWPHLTALVLLYLIATWAIITGVFQLAEAMSGGGRHSSFLLIISGIASILLGIVLFASSPLLALLALVWVIGLYALIDGAMLIARACYLRSLSKHVPQEYREPEFLP
jgi:uncharacterized membrane protein HdeD (DUF308 family)